MTYGYTFGYRRRLHTKEADDGKFTLTIPHDILVLVGAQNASDEFALNVADDGAIVIRLKR